MPKNGADSFAVGIFTFVTPEFGHHYRGSTAGINNDAEASCINIDAQEPSGRESRLDARPSDAGPGAPPPFVASQIGFSTF